MTKAVPILILFLLLCNSIQAQKQDFQWLFGYGGTSGDTSFGDVVLDFNTLPPKVFKEVRQLNFSHAIASYSDPITGELLLYTNGIDIANSKHEIIENGSGLNPGDFSVRDPVNGYNNAQGLFFIKSPGSADTVILIHQAFEIIEVPPDLDLAGTRLYYTAIDISSGVGNEKVIRKNVPLINAYQNLGHLTAVRHGNGRDWWMLMPAYDSNKIFRVKISKDPQFVVDSVLIQDTIFNGGGQAVFSPDGNRFVTVNKVWAFRPGKINIFDFDRCKGELFNERSFMFGDTSFYTGAAISPSSKFLYISDDFKLFQYDLSSQDLKSSAIQVGQYLGELDPLPIRFFHMQLAPDDKIYMRTGTGNFSLHVINQPNEKGLDCDFVKGQQKLGVYNIGIPNFPNYRLGKWADSPCDTLTSTKGSARIEIQNLYPNPASTSICFEILEPGIKDYSIIDGLGNIVKKGKIELSHQNEICLPVDELSNGIYLLKIRSNRGFGVKKFVKG
jgi:hypothetical protein